MSQSLSILYIHTTFSTKNRSRYINETIAPDLHSYIATTFKNLDSPALIVNSMPDHIHVLFRMSKNMPLAKIMEEVKKSSSKWVKQQPTGTQSFYWQTGYAAFSVCSSHVDAVTKYIARQKEHHKTLSYKEEIQRLMEKNGVEEYDSRYYWE